jgi:hypothetical protein
VPVCVPRTPATPDTTAPLATLTVYNPVMAASTPPLTFYNPSGLPSPQLTFYTPLGQIDPPIRTPLPSSPPNAAQSLPTQSTSQSRLPSQTTMPTQTIAAPGPCPPGTQIDRLVR